MNAFGAFLRPNKAGKNKKSPIIALNVEGCMFPPYNGKKAPRRSVNLTKRIVVTTLMHEFGHALEHYLDLPVNERAIEKACEEWNKNER